MPKLIATQLSFQLDSGEWLFKELNFNLAPGLTGLIGRNGVGKSLLVSLLLGKQAPTKGTVTCQQNIANYSQLPSELLHSSQRISDYLGITEKLQALKEIEQGSFQQQYFDLIGDDWQIAENTSEKLKHIGISADLTSFCHQLSGGQLALLQLYRLFKQQPSILILDEPSNHLDSAGKAWLINEIKQFKGKLLVVSHDRALLREMDNIYHLTGLGLQLYKGGYEEFFTQSTMQMNALHRQINNLKSKQKLIVKEGQKNREKAQQRESKGHRLRASGSQSKILLDAKKDKATKALSALKISSQNQQNRNQHKLDQLVAKQETIKPQTLYFQQVDQGKKRTLLTLSQCQLHYGSKQPITFTLNQTEKIALKGRNGCGKSTLLKAIKGQHQDYSGYLTLNSNTVYLDQHFSLLSTNLSMLELLQQQCQNLNSSDARTLLAGIGFRKNSVYRKVHHLSGGEKMKLAMLVVSHQAESPLLLLDEPDNHLDIESKQLLASTLKGYAGSFILVSHDSDFIAESNVDRIIELT